MDCVVAIPIRVSDRTIPCLVRPLGQVLDEVLWEGTVLAKVVGDDHS